MKYSLVFLTLLLYSLNVSAKNKEKETVVVIENVPTTSLYEWQTPGRASVTCSGNTCNGYFTLPNSGTDEIRGAILKLRRPDGSIVIAQCLAKSQFLSSAIISATTHDSGDPQMYRSCRTPEPNTTVEVEFIQSKVKIYMRAPSINGNGGLSSETYLIRGVLHPNGTALIPEVIIPDASKKRYDSLNAELESLFTKQQELEAKRAAHISNCKEGSPTTACLKSAKPLADNLRDVDKIIILLLDEKVQILSTSAQGQNVQIAIQQSNQKLENTKNELSDIAKTLSE